MTTRKSVKTTNGKQIVKVATSLAHASGAWGIPIATLKQAKAAGCPAFCGSRVIYGEFIRWAQENPPVEEAEESPHGREGWQIAKLKREVRKLDLAYQAQVGELVPKAEIKETIAAALQPMLNVLDRHLDKAIYNTVASELKAAILAIAA